MTREIALHCMKSASELERELCEECPIYGQTGCDHCYEDALQYVIGMLEQEPKTGHWIFIGNSDVNGLKICKCDACGKRTYGSHNFCPNCGADMRGEQDE